MHGICYILNISSAGSLLASIKNIYCGKKTAIFR